MYEEFQLALRSWTLMLLVAMSLSGCEAEFDKTAFAERSDCRSDVDCATPATCWKADAKAIGYCDTDNNHNLVPDLADLGLQRTSLAPACWVNGCSGGAKCDPASGYCYIAATVPVGGACVNTEECVNSVSKGAKCVHVEFDVKRRHEGLCSDGSAGSYCMVENDCIKGLGCHDNLCRFAQLGESCYAVDDCGPELKCISGFSPVCTDGKPFSPCNAYYECNSKDCQGHYCN